MTTTELEKKEDILISLDRHDLLSMMSLDPVHDETDSSLQLNIRLSRVAQTAAPEGSANGALIEELHSHENELFSWLGKSPQNGKLFITNPVAAFTTATGASSELLEKIAALGKGELPGTTISGADTGAEIDRLSGAAATAATAALNAWKMPLLCAEDAMCILDAGDTLYAGSNGFIYKLRATDGFLTLYLQVKTLPGLDKVGNREVRLAISDDGQKLFIGTYGYVACVNTSDFKWQWAQKLNGGGDPVNLLVSGKDLYAGTWGNACKMNDDGTGLKTNTLSGRGNHEVRLALSDDKTRLFLGTDGYAMSLYTANMATEWETSLKSTGDNRITILTRGREVYAAGYGRLFKLNFSGHVETNNTLKDRGNHDVRMQFSPDGKSLLLGTDGYVLSINASTLLTQWETDLTIKGGSAVNVLTRGDVVYAGNEGYFIRLTVSTGRMTSKQYLCDGRKQEMGMALSDDGTHLFFACEGSVMKTSSAGDLAAGWQAIAATRQSSVNQTLQSLFAAGMIPHEIESEFTLLKTHYAVRAGITAAPVVIDGGDGRVTLQVALKGDVSSGASKLAMQMSGYVELTADLEKIKASVQEENAEGFLLSIDLAAGDFFDAIDLSHLVITLPLGMRIELADLAAPLLTMMNQALRLVSFPLQFPVHKPLPASLNGLGLRLTYTKVPGGAQKDFLSLLFGAVEGGGSFDLSPAIITDNAETAFIFSNRMALDTIKAGMVNAPRGNEYGFAVSNDYPARLGNANTVHFNDVSGVWLKIDDQYVEIVIASGLLIINVSVSYMNVATFGLWHAMHLRSVSAFASEKGDIRLRFASELDVPWTFFLNIFSLFLLPVVAYIKALIPNLVDGNGDTLIVVPGFDVSNIAIPAYVNIAGKVDGRTNTAETDGLIDVAV
jgi:hypothetical protein